VMGRRSFETYEDVDIRESRSSLRSMRTLDTGHSGEEEDDEEPEPPLKSFDAELLGLCTRFGLEAWAASDSDMGLRSFGLAVQQWLENAETAREGTSQSGIDAIRLVTNLLIIVGAVVRLPQCAGTCEPPRAAETVSAARRSIGWLAGPLSSFPASVQAMKRLTTVRGWRKLSPLQQALAESLLELYLDTLAVLRRISTPSVRAKTLLLTTEAWLEVLRLSVLPVGFDERLLRATSWYLETYVTSHRGG
jgi:hypothetical protein